MITKLINRLVRKKLLKYKNVSAVGIGNKITKDTDTGKKCIKVFVTKKQKKPKDIVPKKVFGIKTDIEEIGEIKLQKDTKSYDPLIGGISIGHYKVTAGTLGCIVYKKGVWDDWTGEYIVSPSTFYRLFSKFKLQETDVPFILSNNHVLADSAYDTDADERNATIVQPGPIDGRLQPPVAYLYDYVPYSENKNYVDCAIAKPHNILVMNEILNIGMIKGISSAFVGQKVKKRGRTTEYTEGIVKATDVLINVKVKDKTIPFYNQIITSVMSAGGDSGSLVLDMENKAVGLLFAGSTSATILNPIQRVLDELDVYIKEVD